MSYTPTDWKTGDVITAEKLNNMESGIVGTGSTFMVTATGDPNTGLTFNKTCGEIKAAIMGGSFVFAEHSLTNDEGTTYIQLPLEQCDFYEGGGCTIMVAGEALRAETDNDYPSNAGQ